jgi:hypothetical protein
MSDFIPTDSGKPTVELYTTDVHWNDFINGISVDYLNDDVYILREIVSKDNLPVLFSIVKLVKSNVIVKTRLNSGINNQPLPSIFNKSKTSSSNSNFELMMKDGVPQTASNLSRLAQQTEDDLVNLGLKPNVKDTKVNVDNVNATKRANKKSNLVGLADKQKKIILDRNRIANQLKQKDQIVDTGEIVGVNKEPSQ